MSKDIQQEVHKLTDTLLSMQHAYYREQRPFVSDREYDRLFDRLQRLEQQYPEYRRKDSPTARVGSDLSSQLPEVSHTIPVLSLDKAYSSSEVRQWMDRTRKRFSRDLSFAAEEKIDGAAIVLYYRDGVLDQAVTRGNGYVGNDVTGNVRTITQVPLRLTDPVTAAVRGEVFLGISDFRRLGDQRETGYANPRNLAAGSLRRVKSSETAKIPLQLCVYEGYIEGIYLADHVEMLQYLAYLGLPLSRHIGVLYPPGSVRPVGNQHFSHWRSMSFDELEEYIRESTDARESRDYEIDGLVFKVNELAAREELGYTGHHPRWAVAFKFESPEAETVIERIETQVGRTGRITPVARVKPVRIGGSVVSNVTLHNQEYIRMLEIAEGDRVSVSKRGDVIPAVERIVEKDSQAEPHWEMPELCPSCSSGLEEKGAHLFCVNPLCPGQVFERIRFFCARGQMDIEGFGPETIKVLIDRGLLKDIPDIYEIDYDAALEGVGGFGQKKIAALKRGVELSRRQPFAAVLPSLGISDIGRHAVELFIQAGYRSIDDLLQLAENHEEQKLAEIHGIGEKLACSLGRALRDPVMRRRIERLRSAGLSLSQEQEDTEGSGVFSGQTWCVTGSFRQYKPRSRAQELIKRHGGKVVSAVSGSLTHLLAGEASGSKLEKARAVGARIVTEEEFSGMLQDAVRNDSSNQ